MDKRKLAHVVIDNIDTNDLDELLKVLDRFAYEKDTTTSEDILGMERAAKEFKNGEYYTHEEIFGKSE